MGISGKLKPEKQLNLQKFTYSSPCKVMKIYEKKNKPKTTTQTVNLNEKKNEKHKQEKRNNVKIVSQPSLRKLRAFSDRLEQPYDGILQLLLKFSLI